MILATVNVKKDLYGVTAEELSAIAPNINLGLLTAYVKSKGIAVDMIDSEADGISIQKLIDMISKERPILCGIVVSGSNPSSSTMTMSGVIDFFSELRSANSAVKTFLWGPHPTVLPERSLRETGAGYVVRGEGYDTIVDLYNAVSSGEEVDTISGLSYAITQKGENKYVHTKDAPLIRDVDSLPMIDWETMNPAKYRAHNWHCFSHLDKRTPYAIIWTSFGCPFKCNYCTINNLFGRRIQRFRSVDSVIDEIDILVRRYKVEHLKIMDELFVVNEKRIETFCDRLEERGYDLNMWSYARADTINRRLLKRMKRVGMNWISYGFETGTPEMLDRIEKGYADSIVPDAIRMTREEGIDICADVMFGLWEDDMASLQQTYNFLVKHNFEWANMYPMLAYPGSKVYKNFEEPKSWKTYALYGYECVPAGTRHLSPRDILEFRDKAFISYYTRATYLDMVENKFGLETRAHITRMTDVPLRRKLLEDQPIA